MDAARGRGPFLPTVLFLLAFAAFLHWGYPGFAGWLGGKPGPPGAGHHWPLYFGLAVLGCLAWLTYDETRWRAFQAPVHAFLLRRGLARNAVLAAIPLAAGGWALALAHAGSPEPVANPIRHPTPPDAFMRLRNPFRDAGPEAVEEGRVLYQTNCRPCHGTKATGDGPVARGQRRTPADFTGVETIATLVEGAVFWRVKTGGIGLPPEGAPWESAMPRWETDLSDEQIWKIILAEYDTAGNAPREPEAAE